MASRLYVCTVKYRHPGRDTAGIDNVRTMRLKQEEIALLRMLESEDGAVSTAPSGPLADVPRSMFELNLVSRLGTGALQLTKTGARALFQAECIAALEQTLAGGRPAMLNGVERWLTSSGFLHPEQRTITARGKLWLASLTPKGADGAEGANSAADSHQSQPGSGSPGARRDAA